VKLWLWESELASDNKDVQIVKCLTASQLNNGPSPQAQVEAFTSCTVYKSPIRIVNNLCAARLVSWYSFRSR